MNLNLCSYFFHNRIIMIINKINKLYIVSNELIEWVRLMKRATMKNERYVKTSNTKIKLKQQKQQNAEGTENKYGKEIK